MSAPPSVLSARDGRLGPWFAAAAAGHVGAVLGLWVLQGLTAWWAPDDPFLTPEEVIEVSMVEMPKSTAMPTRATRQAAPQAQPQPPEPVKSNEPPPPRQSDLVVQQPTPEPVPVAPPDHSRKLDALREELRMDQLLDDLDDADPGAVDRDATSPDGTEGAKPTKVVGSQSGDPEAARYIAELSKLFLSHFRPLPMLKGQGLRVTVLVKVDAQGKILEHRVEKSSGNPSWDRAALAAVEEVGTVPRPPEKYRHELPAYRTTFEDN